MTSVVLQKKPPSRQIQIQRSSRARAAADVEDLATGLEAHPGILTSSVSFDILVEYCKPFSITVLTTLEASLKKAGNTECRGASAGPSVHEISGGPVCDLVTHFKQYFEILRADTPDLLEQAFRLRYQVYCQEGCLPGFDPLDYPDGLERDIYDYEGRSVHCLLRHRATGTNAGTVRLVLADPVRPDAPFPIEVAAGEHIDRGYLSKFCAARGTIAESSRFILAERFRSRRGERQWADGLVEEVIDTCCRSDERRVLPHPVLGLIKAAMIMSWEQEVRYWYTAMEPRLDRRLRQFGMMLEPVSPLVDYHGSVRAHWGFLPEVFANMRQQRPEVWYLLTENGKIWPAPRDDGASEMQRKAS